MFGFGSILSQQEGILSNQVQNLTNKHPFLKGADAYLSLTYTFTEIRRSHLD
jgi:hypothetical protein